VEELVTIEHFRGKEGDRFDLVIGDDQALPMTLTEVRPGVKRGQFPEPFRVPFSLFFNGTPGRLCEQKTYWVRHASGWQTQMFVVPIGDRPDGTYVYQAVYS
jgi:hypothetical protein